MLIVVNVLTATKYIKIGLPASTVFEYTDEMEMILSFKSTIYVNWKMYVSTISEVLKMAMNVQPQKCIDNLNSIVLVVFET